MSDLIYTVKAEGAKDVEALTQSLESLHKVLSAGKGSGKSLEEVRKLIVGFKGQASVFEEMRTSMQSMQKSVEDMSRSVPVAVRSLTRAITSEMKVVTATMRMDGISAGKALSEGISESLTAGTIEVKGKAKALAKAVDESLEVQDYSFIQGIRNLTKTATAEAVKVGAAFSEIAKSSEAGKTRSLASLKELEQGIQSFGAVRDRVMAKFGSQATPDTGLRLLTQKANEDVQSLNAAYKRLQDVSEIKERVMAKFGSQATPDTGLRLLTQKVNEDIASLNAAYKKLEQTADLKDRIRARLGTSLEDTGRLLQGSSAQTSVRGSLTFDYGSKDYSKGMDELRKSYAEVETKQTSLEKSNGSLSSSFKKLTVDGNDVHSMARGLASGFNLLWLTWGNLVPLFVGAAISNGFMQTAKTGLQVAHSLEVMSTLGKEAGDSLLVVASNTNKLTTELISLGRNGIFGPQDLAEAMKTLTLAGLKTNEVLSTIAPTIALAVAGTTDLKTAADVLVSITTAFGTGAAGFREASDIIVRAAADSKASVESIGEAIKLASTVGEQYGASLTDVATLTGLLANLGIQGTSAGTAIRNMFVDMSERTPKTAKIMRDFGLEFRTAAGGMKPVLENIQQLDKALRTLDGKSAANLMQALFSERGAKPAVAALAEYRKAAVDANGAVLEWTPNQNKLVKSLESTKNSAGDAAIAAAQLAQTSLNSFNALGATLKTTMFQAFKEMEPQLYLVSVQLRNAFASPEFLGGLTGLVSAVANLTRFLVENGQVIATLAIGYGAYKVGVMAAAAASATLQGASLALTRIFPQIASSSSTAAVAVTALAAAKDKDAVATLRANAASSTGLGLLGGLGRLLPGIGTAITLAGTAWSIYSIFSGKANEASQDYTAVRADQIVKALDKETEKLKFLNDERARGISLAAAEDAWRDNEQRKTLSTSSAGPVEAAQRAAETASDRLRNLREKEAARKLKEDRTKISDRSAAFNVAMSPYTAQINEATAEEAKAWAKYSNLVSERDASMAALEDSQARHRKESARNVASRAAEARAVADEVSKMYSGGKTFSLINDETPGGGRPQVSSARQEVYTEQKALTEITKARDEELANSKRNYDLQKQLLDNKQKNELISRTDYAIQVAAQTESFEERQLNSLREYNSKYQDQSLKAIAELQRNEENQRKAGNRDRADNFKSLAETQREAAIRIARDTAEKIENISAEAATRNQIILQDMAGEASKLLREDDKVWKDREDKLAAAKDLAAINEQYRYLNTSVFSAAEGEKAYALAMAETMSSVKAQNKSLEDLAAHLQAVADAQYAVIMSKDYSGQEDGMSQADTDRLEKLLTAREAVKRLRQRISENTENGFKQGTSEGMLAMEKVMRDKRDSLTGGLASALETGLSEGSDAAAAALRKTLEDELLRKPFRAFVQAGVSFLLDGAIGGLSALFGGSGGSGSASGGNPISTLLNMASGASTAYKGYTALSSYFSSSGGVTGLTPGMSLANPGMAATINPVSTPTWAAAAGPAAAAAAVAAVVLNAFGAFRSERKVGGGIAGTLGEGSLTPWEEWRKGGTLFSGPDYSTINPVQSIADTQAKLDALRSAGQGDTMQASLLQGQLNSLQEMYGGLAASTAAQSKALQTAYETLRTNAGDMADVLGLGSEAVRKFTTQLGGSSKGLDFQGLTAEQQQAKIAEALATASNELAMQVIGKWETFTNSVTQVVGRNIGGENTDVMYAYEEVTSTTTGARYVASELAKDGEKAIDTLTRLATSLQTANAAFERFGARLYESSLAGGNIASKLMDAAGGAEAFSAKASTYYEAFFTESERVASTSKDIATALSKVGVTMPKTREEFRELVSANVALGESGISAVAALLSVSEAFAGITDTVETVFQVLARLRNPVRTTEEVASSILKLADENASLNADLLEAQGRTSEADAIRRSLETRGFSEWELALYDSNKALKTQIDLLGKLSSSMEEYAKKNAKSLTEYNRIMGYSLNNDTQGLLGLGVPAALLHGSHADGLAYVPFDGYRAELHKGERVLTAQENRSYAGSSDDAKMTEALLEQLELLRLEVRAGVSHSAALSRLFKRLVPDGDALAVREAPAV